MKRIHVVARVLACMVLSFALSGLAGCGAQPEPMPNEQAQQADADKTEVQADEPAKEADEEPTEDAEPAAKQAVAGPLHVEGTQLVDEGGQAVQLRGISTHGLSWFPQYVNAELFGELGSQWGANVVRLAMYTAEGGGYCTDGDQGALRQLVLDGVDYATDAGLYVIVDWHILSDNNPLDHADEAEAFFQDMSATLAGHDNVLYEICNEPNGATSWADVKAYAERIIPVIRANDPGSVVLVGTPEWCQRPDQAAQDPLDFDNVLYTVHFYAATHKDDLRNRTSEAVKGGLPVFVSEFGICDASGNGQIDLDSANAWTKTLDDLGVSYIMWNLSNKDESSSAIDAACQKVSGFTDEDLSVAGRWLRATLADDVDAAASVEPPAPTLVDGDLALTYTVVNSWPEGDKTCYQYALTIRNDGAALDGWEVHVPFDQAIELKDGWNGVYEVQGQTLRIANASYNGQLPAGGEIADIGFQLLMD